jgi:hypothetical protein
MLMTAACSTLAQPFFRPQSPYAPAAPLSPADPFIRDGAAKYHALAPHYVRQETESSCSVASTTMVLNTALGQRGKRPVSQATVLGTDRTGRWRAATAHDMAPGVDLDGLSLLVMQAFYSFGLREVGVDVVHVRNESTEALNLLRHDLDLSERFPNDYFILANFRQGSFLRAGGGGHISVVGAYDEAHERVLILDVDRAGFEPYWIPTRLFLAGMHTPDDETGEPRGYLVVRMSR